MRCSTAKGAKEAKSSVIEARISGSLRRVVKNVLHHRGRRRMGQAKISLFLEAFAPFAVN